MKQTMFNIPEPNLEPPEDRRKIFASCPICEEPIREGDEAWDIPNYGYCCARCISDAHIHEVEVTD